MMLLHLGHDGCCREVMYTFSKYARIYRFRCEGSLEGRNDIKVIIEMK